MLCPLIGFGFLHAPVPPPSTLEKKKVCRNLFNTAPGDAEVDQLLAQEQQKKRFYVKERFGFDIQHEARRSADADANVNADAVRGTDTDAQALRGMRYPTTRTIPSSDADECNPKAVSEAPRGIALTPAEISTSARLILRKGPESNSSADLANSTRHVHKPYAMQPQGLKGMYNVRKVVKGISKSNVKNSYNNYNSNKNNINNNNNNNTINNIDNGTSELTDKKQ
ncbi:gliolectin [Drosophila erecta]|uniref:GG12555 n=1 Tax=Drosophila erecta TaxID=7220 RepID=B3P8R8_DROER|nr:gliolectin [Drosophila erecta]EDV54232.1 uncharacterized protein Dere_GG12555 [Drosophila erecta]